MTVDELLETFDFLEDWDERCDYLVEIGSELPPMPDELKTDETYVHGCQSRAWLASRLVPGDPQRIEFLGDADALIVRGVIYVLLTVYSGRTPREILDTDIDRLIARIGLDKMLKTRKTGINSMVKRIRSIAEKTIADCGLRIADCQ